MADLSNPIINGPYDPPARHFEVGATGPPGVVIDKSLAEEAGVKQWVLTHKHQGLQDDLRTMVKRTGREPETVRLLKVRVEELTQATRRLRAQLREAKSTYSMLERQIAVEALEAHTTDRARRELAATRLRPVP